MRSEIERIKKSFDEIEAKDISVFQRRKLLDEKYREAVDYIEKLLIKFPYTTLKTEVYNLQGEIYKRMGMLNSAEKSFDNAKKYKN
jgi:tetratricopeptide (TPR) repeat protein